MTRATAAPMIDRTAGIRVAGLSGVLWAVLSLSRVPMTGEADLPPREATPQQITSFFEVFSAERPCVLGMGLVTVGWALLLVFVAMVADLIGRIDRALRWLGHLALAGAVVEVAIVTSYLAAFATGAFWATHGGLDTDAYLLLHGFSWTLLWLDSVLFAVWLVPLGLASISTRLFPSWLGWAMVATACAGVFTFFLSFQILVNVVGALPYLWIFIAGSLMLVRSSHYAISTAAEDGQ